MKSKHDEDLSSYQTTMIDLSKEDIIFLLQALEEDENPSDRLSIAGSTHLSSSNGEESGT